MSLNYYNSGNSSELVNSIPVPEEATIATKRVVFSVELEDMDEDDILLATAELQGTLTKSYNTMFVGQLILGEAPTSLSGKEITEANGFNITPNMHHGVMVKVGAITLKSSDLNKKHVNLLAYAASDAAKPGDELIVQQDYGRLSIIQIKKNPAMEIFHYVSGTQGNNSELTDCLPITKSGDQPRVILSVEMENALQEGDILQVLSEYEATNDTGFNVSIVSQVKLSNAFSSLTGKEITEANGFNITPGMHHGLIIKNGTIQIDSSMTGLKYFNLIARARSSLAEGGETLKIERDYGRLSVIHYKKKYEALTLPA